MMRRTLLSCLLIAGFACSQDHTEDLNAGVDSGVCDPATDFFCVDTPDSGSISVDSGEKDQGEKPEDKPKGTALARWSGEFDTVTHQGHYRFRSIIDKEDNTDCDVSFDISTATTTTACTDCDFAWLMVLGTSTTAVNGDGCAVQKSKTGDTIGFGHQAPAQLYLEKEGDWFPFGTSTVNGDAWNFFLEYSF